MGDFYFWVFCGSILLNKIRNDININLISFRTMPVDVEIVCCAFNIKKRLNMQETFTCIIVPSIELILKLETSA